MESFAKLKRRGTDLLNSVSQNMPSMPSMPHMPHMPQMPHMPRMGGGPTMKGTWQHIALPPLPRSSHTLDIIAGNAYIFGGEVEARKPVDNDMHIIVLPSSGANADYYAVKAKPSPKTQAPATITEEDETAAQLKDPLTEVPLSSPPPPGTSFEEQPSSSTTEKGKGKPLPSDVPSPRIGHASAVIGPRIFIFGGRTSPAGSDTLDEGGRVWVFETKTHTWSYLDPYRTSPSPPPRSYFAAVATDKPSDFAIKPLRRTSSWKEWAEGDSAEVGIPQRPITGHIAAGATDDEDAGFGTFIIHGGCLADGSRTSDVWAFDVRSCTWKELPSAPGPARGGAALAIAKSRLYRFGGFDGEKELGGQLDVLELSLDEFDDRVSRGEIGVFARGEWSSHYPPVTASPPPSQQDQEAGGDDPAAEPTIQDTARLIETEAWPAARSVSSLNLVLGGGGREYLVLMLGERSASASGHEAAGSFHGDVWTFQVPPLGMTAASVTDAVLQAVGRKTGEGVWTRVATGPEDEDEALDVKGPTPRGWIASATLGDLGENAVMVFGGLSEGNQRLGDGWIFRLG
ncbi:Uu.00g102600.m01.CDS01 [Anthostomella pinea]|uniref:Uu.00g102600.m01.CDS01 n=1 Tax=Anthostomella pinea TaxID=933095 RepID=A0AAI8VDC9_9PEZI|nr:Uu.00g102600.m01.CDS01 [Anthostomella pinea]